MRLAFMGTPDFALPVLQALVAAGHDVVRVYSQPPRPAGRGKTLRPSPVHKYADSVGIEVETPRRFRDETVLQQFEALHLDAAIIVAYGQILPQRALDAPSMGCLNLHASLLPRWRGAAPIHRALMAGDRETGVGVMQMEAGLDTGPILAEARTPIGAQDTTASLHDRLAAIGAPLMADTLAAMQLGTVEARPQSETGVTYAHKIEKTEARIDWTRPADEVDRHIRALSPFPGAWCEILGDRTKILMSSAVDGAGAPGTVLDGSLRVACREGAVHLMRLQRAGKSATDRETFLNGFPVVEGTVLN